MGVHRHTGFNRQWKGLYVTDTSDFRNGMIIKLEGNLFSIVEFQHVKPGKGGAFVRTKLKRIPEGAVVDKTFRAGERVEEVRVERHTFQYLYSSDHLYYMMNTESYEQIPLQKSLLEDALPYLKEGTNVSVLMNGEIPIAVAYRRVGKMEDVGLVKCVREEEAYRGKKVRFYMCAVDSLQLCFEKGHFSIQVQPSTDLGYIEKEKATS